MDPCPIRAFATRTLCCAALEPGPPTGCVSRRRCGRARVSVRQHRGRGRAPATTRHLALDSTLRSHTGARTHVAPAPVDAVFRAQPEFGGRAPKMRKAQHLAFLLLDSSRIRNNPNALLPTMLSCRILPKKIFFQKSLAIGMASQSHPTPERPLALQPHIAWPAHTPDAIQIS